MCEIGKPIETIEVEPNKKLLSRIMAQMSLPFETETSTDDHYRCPACLGRAG